MPAIMPDSRSEWTQLREDLLAAVQEEFKFLRGELRKDLRQEISSCVIQRSVVAKSENAMSVVRGINDTLRSTSNPERSQLSVPSDNDRMRSLAEDEEIVIVREEGALFTEGGRTNINHGEIMPNELPLPGQPISDENTYSEKCAPCNGSKQSASMSSASISSFSSQHRFRKRRWRKPRLQQALGTVPDIEIRFVNDSGIARKAEEMVRAAWFEYGSMSFILLTTVLSGFIVNHRATNLTEDIPAILRVADLVCFVYFCGEVVLRLVAYHRRYFDVLGWGWHVFDLALVVLQLLEEVLEYISGGNRIRSVEILRVCRLLRAVRCIRVMKISLYASELRLLASCVVTSFSSFIWATAFLFLLIYIMAIYMTDSLVPRRIEIDHAHIDHQRLANWYGSVPRSCLSLFQALTGGQDWNDLLMPLEFSPFLMFCFIAYIAFGCIALLNLVNGLFVQNAMERAEAVQDMMRLYQARKLFSFLDGDDSQQISLDELMTQINSEAVQSFFNSADLDEREVQLLFNILDHDGEGTIDFEEFVNGMLRLQGAAKSVDMLMMNHGMLAAFRSLNGRRS